MLDLALYFGVSFLIGYSLKFYEYDKLFKWGRIAFCFLIPVLVTVIVFCFTVLPVLLSGVNEPIAIVMMSSTTFIVAAIFLISSLIDWFFLGWAGQMGERRRKAGKPWWIFAE